MELLKNSDVQPTLLEALIKTREEEFSRRVVAFINDLLDETNNNNLQWTLQHSADGHEWVSNDPAYGYILLHQRGHTIGDNYRIKLALGNGKVIVLPVKESESIKSLCRAADDSSYLRQLELQLSAIPDEI